MTFYRHHADSYNSATAVFCWLRRQAVEQLGLQPGNTVIDAGCGTGLCFSYLQKAIGPTGQIIAIDQNGSMLAQATAMAARNEWRNITFIHSAAQSAAIPARADAALFCAVHDILHCTAAVQNILAQVKPGGRVVAAGGKWPDAWLWPLHVVVSAIHAPFVTSLEGFERPWTPLLEHCPDLHIEPVALGTGYLAVGSLRPRLLAA